MSEFEGMFEGMDGEEVEKMLHTHPLTVFSRLAHDEPESKVYRQCLENEIDDAATSMMQNLDDLQFSLLEHVVTMLNVSGADEDSDEVLRVKTIKRIIREVRRRKEAEKE